MNGKIVPEFQAHLVRGPNVDVHETPSTKLLQESGKLATVIHFYSLG